MTLMMCGPFPETVNQFPACLNTSLRIRGRVLLLNTCKIKRWYLGKVVTSSLGVSQTLIQHVTAVTFQPLELYVPLLFLPLVFVWE